MFTKKMMAAAIVESYCKENEVSVGNNYSDIRTHIYSSSKLAVALETLGVLSKEEKEYSSSRGGIEEVITDCTRSVHVFSTRDLISLLPDSLDRYSGLSAEDILKFISEYADMFCANAETNEDSYKWSGMRLLIDEVVDHIREKEKEYVEANEIIYR